MALGGNVEVKSLSDFQAVNNLYVSGSIVTSGAMQLGQTLVDGDSDLVLSSSATSRVVVSGNLDVLGNFTLNGSPLNVDITGAGNFFVTNTLDARGKINNTVGTLILSASNSQTVISGNLTVLGNGNVNIAGDVTVGGTVTFVSSSNLVVYDPLIVLAQSQSGAPQYDAGFVVERGTGENRALVWRETDGRFATVTTDETGSTAGSIIVKGYAPFKAKDLFLHSGNIVADQGHLILSSSVGSRVTISGTSLAFSLATINPPLVSINGTDGLQFSAPGGLTSTSPHTFASTAQFNGNSNFLGTTNSFLNGLRITDVGGVIQNTVGHLILSSSVGSRVLISGNFTVQGGLTASSIETSGRVNLGSAGNRAAFRGSSISEATLETVDGTQLAYLRLAGLNVNGSVGLFGNGNDFRIGDGSNNEGTYIVVDGLAAKIKSPTKHLILSSSVSGSVVQVSGVLRAFPYIHAMDDTPGNIRGEVRIGGTLTSYLKIRWQGGTALEIQNESGNYQHLRGDILMANNSSYRALTIESSDKGGLNIGGVSALVSDTTRQQLLFGLGAPAGGSPGYHGRSLVISNYESSSIGDGLTPRNFDHGTQANPSVFIHSLTDPDVDNTQYLGLTHKVNHALLWSGSGSLVLSSSIGSSVKVSGNLDVVGTLSINGVGIGASSAASILSSSDNSVIASSGSIDFSETNKPYHIRATNSRLILSSSVAGSRVFVSGVLQVPYLSAEPTIRLGDDSVGISAVNQNLIYFWIQGLQFAKITNDVMGAAGSGPQLVLGFTPSPTVASIIPTSGDPDTGISYHASDRMSFKAGGKDMITVSSGSTLDVAVSGTLTVNGGDIVLSKSQGRLWFSPSTNPNSYITDDGNTDGYRFYANNSLKFQIRDLADQGVILNSTLSLNGNRIRQTIGDMILTSSDGSVILVSGNLTVPGWQGTSSPFSEQLGALAVAFSHSSTAVGYSARAMMQSASALGAFASASGVGSLAVGHAAWAQGTDGIALGRSARVSTGISIGRNAGSTSNNNTGIIIGAASTNNDSTSLIIIGAGSSAQAQSILIGQGSQATATNSIVIGNSTFNSKNTNIIIGNGIGSGDIGGNGTAVAVGDDAKCNTNSVSVGASAGGSNGTEMGFAAVAVGHTARAHGEDAVAIGRVASAQNSGSISIGAAASGTANWAISIGLSASARANDSIVIGRGSSTTQSSTLLGTAITNAWGQSVLVGGSVVNDGGQTSVLIGYNASSTGGEHDHVVIGSAASSGRGKNVVIGASAKAPDGFQSVVIGQEAQADGASVFDGNNAIAIGHRANVSASGSIAIGTSASVDLGHSGSIAIGWNVRSDGEYQVRFDTSSRTRQLKMFGPVVGGNHLILSSSAGSVIAASGNLEVLGKVFATDLALSGTTVTTSGTVHKWFIGGNQVAEFSNNNGIVLQNLGVFIGDRLENANGATPLKVGSSTTSQGLASSTDLLVAGKGEFNGTLYADFGIRLTGSLVGDHGHLILSNSAGSAVAMSGVMKLHQVTSTTLPPGSDTLSGSMVWVSDIKVAAIYGPEGWTRIVTGSAI